MTDLAPDREWTLDDLDDQPGFSSENVAAYRCGNCSTVVPAQFTNDVDEPPIKLPNHACGEVWDGCGEWGEQVLVSEGYLDAADDDGGVSIDPGDGDDDEALECEVCEMSLGDGVSYYTSTVYGPDREEIETHFCSLPCATRAAYSQSKSVELPGGETPVGEDYHDH